MTPGTADISLVDRIRTFLFKELKDIYTLDGKDYELRDSTFHRMTPEGDCSGERMSAHFLEGGHICRTDDGFYRQVARREYEKLFDLDENGFLEIV